MLHHHPGTFPVTKGRAAMLAVVPLTICSVSQLGLQGVVRPTAGMPATSVRAATAADRRRRHRGVAGLQPPAMFARLSCTLCVSGSPGGRARSQRAAMSRSTVSPSVSRPTA